MVEIIENISLVEGRILSRTPSPTRAGFDDLTVVLDGAEPVDERAELLGQRLGEELVISAPVSLLGSANAGSTLRGHVIVAGPGLILAAPQAVTTGGEFTVFPGPELGDPAALSPTPDT